MTSGDWREGETLMVASRCFCKRVRKRLKINEMRFALVVQKSAPFVAQGKQERGKSDAGPKT
jgi:hypothetical protein